MTHNVSCIVVFFLVGVLSSPHSFTGALHVAGEMNYSYSGTLARENMQFMIDVRRYQIEVFDSIGLGFFECVCSCSRYIILGRYMYM